jgi:phospholipid/cholesterol/gamma-HCH transport system substrate-binding protein
MRAFRSGMSPVRAGLIALVIILVGAWFAFSKDIPFTQTYKIEAVFENSNLVAPRSPVRIAGIDVGKVVEVKRYKDTDMSVVTMEITDNGRPVGEDATAKIRPRLFLEGNFFVDLKPGTPGAEELPDGGLIPVTQTSTPVQLDQILTSLQSDTRRGLQDTFIGFGEALDSEPTEEENLDLDVDVQGLTGAESLNKALETAVPALRGSAVGAQALQGTEKHDLSKMVKGIAGISRGLARNENQLSEYITDFNITVAALASKAPQLEETVRLLGPTASNLRKGLASVDAALPATQRFATDILPGVRQTPATVAAAGPWLDQAIPFFSSQELGALLADITPATQDLARATHESIPLVRESNDFNRCITDVILPTGNIKVDDGDFSVDEENYKEFWYAVAGQAGEGGGFDGNGPFLRLSAPGGSRPLTTGKTNYSLEPLHANATLPVLRTSPAFPNKLPPLRRDVPCYKNPVPDVNGSSSVGPADGSAPNASAPSVPTPGLGAQPVDASASRLLPLSSFAGGTQ